jgi:hypothetical protein
MSPHPNKSWQAIVGVVVGILIATAASCGGDDRPPITALARSLVALERRSLPPHLTERPSRLARLLALKPVDVGNGAKNVPNPPPASVPSACDVRRTLLTEAIAHAATPLLQAGTATFSGIVGVYADREPASRAYSALTASQQGDCYIRLIRAEIRKRALPRGPSRLVEERLTQPADGTVYEVATTVLTAVGEVEVSAKIAVLRQGSSIFLTISSVIGLRDTFDLLNVTADAVIHRYRTLLMTDTP